MMKLRRSLKNSARAARNSLILTGLLLFFGCTSSTSPTYLKEDITKAIEDICKNEYKTEVKTKHIGQTLWIYIPVEDMLTKADKPEKYTEKFEIQDNKGFFSGEIIKLSYLIKTIPEKEKTQEYGYNKAVSEKTNNVWKALRRVIFSMDRSAGGEPKFFVMVIADIKNGLLTKEIFYYLDLKKVSYQFVSWTEYQHRAILDTEVSPEVIGDKEGNSLQYTDITLEEFIIDQIQHRIKLKFQKPEVNKNADIDKEILKIISYTLNTYGFKAFKDVELENLLTNKKTILNQAAILAGPGD